MSNQSIELNDELCRYLLTVSLREDPVLDALRRETSAMAQANMQIAPEQGQFMALLLRLAGARTYLEVGTFTGYSALAAALAMPDGTVHALDSSEEWTARAQRYWRLAGVDERIRLHLGPASESLRTLTPKLSGAVDAMFIDADKTGYAAYIEAAHTLLRSGGLLMIDNVLWGGSVIDPAADDPDTVAIREVNVALQGDARWDISLVPIGDGLTLAVKR